MTVTPGLGGDPEAVRALAIGLRTRAEAIGALLDLGGAGSKAGGWTGEAAQQYAREIHRLTGVLDAVAQRYAIAEVALGIFADEFEAAQRDQWRAAMVGQQAFEERMGLEYTLRTTIDEVTRAVVLARIDDLRVREAQAAARERRAYDAYVAADGVCAKRIGTLTDDLLSDRGVYAVVSGAETWGSRVSWVSLGGRWFPPLEVIGWVADGISTVAATTRFLVWREGDGSALLLAWGATALGGFGSMARKGSNILSAEEASAKSYFWGLKEGAKAQQARVWSDRLAKLRTITPVKGVNPAPTTGGLVGFASRRIRAAGDSARAQWQLASQTSAAGRGLFIDGWAATGASAAITSSQRAQDSSEKVELLREGRQQGLRSMSPTGAPTP